MSGAWVGSEVLHRHFRPKEDGHAFIPKLTVPPQQAGDANLKVGIFGGVHGDEPAGSQACFQLYRWARQEQREMLRGYELHFYPICNPSGFARRTRESHSGKDLNREFWTGSCEPEVRFLEEELRSEKYDALISLHADDTSDGLYGFVSGALLTELVLEPALQAASAVLPRNHAACIDGFPAERGIIKEGYPGILSAPPERRSQTLEIVFETPAMAPLLLQVQAARLAVQAILRNYKSLYAYGQDL